jgi:hypothetical protein
LKLFSLDRHPDKTPNQAEDAAIQSSSFQDLCGRGQVFRQTTVTPFWTVAPLEAFSFGKEKWHGRIVILTNEHTVSEVEII